MNTVFSASGSIQFCTQLGNAQAAYLHKIARPYIIGKEPGNTKEKLQLGKILASRAFFSLRPKKKPLILSYQGFW